MNSKYVYALAGLMLGLTACSNEDLTSQSVKYNGETVLVSLTVNRGDTGTRTTLEENNQNGSLVSKWEEGDILHVYNTSGDEIGSLEIESGWETPVGVFSGTVEGVKDGDFVSLFYYNMVDGIVAKDDDSKRLKIDLSSQSFSGVSDLAQLDILTSADPNAEDLSDGATVQLSVKADNTATVKRDVTLKSKLAFARFTLNNLPTDAKGTLYITDVDDNLYVKHDLAFATGDRVYDEKSSQGIKIENVEAGKDVYVALVPNAKADVKGYTLKFKFVNDGDGKVYTCRLTNPTTIEAGKYYCALPGEGETDLIGISISMEDNGNGDDDDDDEVVGPEFEIKVYNKKGELVTRKARFTRANLHFSTADRTWYIPENQTDYVGKAGHATAYGQKYTSVASLDLFRWGATDYSDGSIQTTWPDTQKYANYANAGWLTGSYLPYKYTGTSTNLASTSDLNGNVKSMRTYKVDNSGNITSHRCTDWGYVYALQQNTADIYYTLSLSEWQEIVDKYVHCTATVAGKKGFIMLPVTTLDEAKKLLTDNGINNSKFRWVKKVPDNVNAIASFTWDLCTIADYDKLADMGAVFFPAAGHAVYNVTSDYSGDCYYWTSDESQTNAHYFCIRNLGTSSGVFAFDEGKNGGHTKANSCSVRLVKVVDDLSDLEIVK